MAHPQSGYSSTVSRSNWNLEMLVFVEGGKPEYLENNPQSRDENQQQTQPTYGANSGNRTRVTLVGGECSQHCAIPAPTNAENTPRSGYEVALIGIALYGDDLIPLGDKVWAFDRLPI